MAKDTPVRQTNEHKFLGLTIDRNLNFNSQFLLHKARSRHIANIVRIMRSNNHGITTRCSLMLANSLLRSYILYSLPFMLCRKEKFEARYHTIQASYIKPALGLLRSCKPTAAIAEAGEKPLFLQAETQLSKYFIRMTTNHPDHLIFSLLEEDTTTIGGVYQNCMGKIKPSATQTNALIDKIIPGSLEINTCTHIGYPGIHKRKTAPETIKLHFNVHIENLYPNIQRTIYTDGSTSEQGSTAAFYDANSGLTQTFKLPFMASSTTAELVAIREALKYLQMVDMEETILILTDSKSAIQSLENLPSKAANPQLIIEIHEHLSNINSTIYFQWCPAHIGISGNETADALCAEAYNSGIQLENIVKTKKQYYKHLHHTEAGNHEKWWTTQNHLFRYHIDPVLNTLPIQVNKLPARYDVVLRRLRTGEALTNTVLHKYKKLASPECQVCKVDDTIEHKIILCNRYNKERKQMLHNLQMKHSVPSLSLSVLLTAPLNTKRDLLPQFLEETGLLYSL